MTRYRTEILICLFLIIATLAVYLQVKHHDFINYDYNNYIIENPLVESGWTMKGLKSRIEVKA